MKRIFISFAAVLAFSGTALAGSDMEKNPFGVLEFLQWNHNWNNYQYSTREKLLNSVRLMKQAGVGIVRMDFLWQDIEPKEGEFDFSKYDRIVDALERSGIAILGILQYSADWASPAGAWNVPSPDNTRFLAYVRKVAARYKGRVTRWEVWNEPDSPVYWKEQDGLKTYCRMLRETYLCLKEIDPGNVVLNGGLTHTLSNVNRLYDNGGKGYFDILNIHIFEQPSPAAVKRLGAYVRACAKIMDRNGDGAKTIWVTEMGCPGVRRGKRVKKWWMGENPGEREQADWVTQAYTALLAEPRVEKVFWAFFRDTSNHFKDGTDYFGLVRNDFSEKPSYKAYRRLHRSWQERIKE